MSAAEARVRAPTRPKEDVVRALTLDDDHRCSLFGLGDIFLSRPHLHSQTLFDLLNYDRCCIAYVTMTWNIQDFKRTGAVVPTPSCLLNDRCKLDSHHYFWCAHHLGIQTSPGDTAGLLTQSHGVIGALIGWRHEVSCVLTTSHCA